MLGHGTGPKNVKENKMNSKMKGIPQRSRQEDCEYKKDSTVGEFSSYWQV